MDQFCFAKKSKAPTPMLHGYTYFMHGCKHYELQMCSPVLPLTKDFLESGCILSSVSSFAQLRRRQ